MNQKALAASLRVSNSFLFLRLLAPYNLAANTVMISKTYGGFRFPIEARIDSRTFEKFHIDIGIGDICIEPLEQLQGKCCLEFCGIPTPTYRVISVEQQFAEKIHAYTLPREHGYNSRVKDLTEAAALLTRISIEPNVRTIS